MQNEDSGKTFIQYGNLLIREVEWHWQQSAVAVGDYVGICCWDEQHCRSIRLVACRTLPVSATSCFNKLPVWTGLQP
jgi:hypothetical protein